MASIAPTTKIVVIGLGYVGLPLLVSFSKKFSNVIGFDIDQEKITELNAKHDRTGEVSPSDLKTLKAVITSDPAAIKGAAFYIITVPTPIDLQHRPELSALRSASTIVGKALTKGSIIVYESTVYPGVTEDICAPILQSASGLTREDFKLGYSPERINPGDKEHTLENVIKVVSGEDAETLDKITALYESVVKAGVFKATSIKVAEAAKVIENTQRDLNIALMNELALIFDLIGIKTRDVLQAAGTKWNFLKFVPGLVGGHCIGVDPYYLTTKAEELGYHPQVILAGRRINDGMGIYIAQRVIKLLVNAGVAVKGAKVSILGLTFKENVPDIRNSRVPDIVKELREFGIDPKVHDPFAVKEESQHEYGIKLASWDELKNADAVILAVSHKQFKEKGAKEILGLLKNGGVCADVKGMLTPAEVPANIAYWSL